MVKSRRMNTITLIEPKQRNKTRVCACSPYEMQGRFGFLYGILIEISGEKTTKCQSCMCHGLGFVPGFARVQRLPVTCDICGGNEGRIVFRRAMTEIRTSYGSVQRLIEERIVCFECYKKFKRDGGDIDREWEVHSGDPEDNYSEGKKPE